MLQAVALWCLAMYTLRRGKRKGVEKGWEEWVGGFHMHGSGGSNSGSLMEGKEKEGVGRLWGGLGKPTRYMTKTEGTTLLKRDKEKAGTKRWGRDCEPGAGRHIGHVGMKERRSNFALVIL